MKEYIAETGGRYTYTDDFLNLQELTLSLTSLFEGCSNFIISGCEVSGNDISGGYVWLNKKIRRFAGAKTVGFPYFIYEANHYDTVTYANEVNKKGRVNYLCSGGAAVPGNTDGMTGRVPEFIEIKKDYAPRLTDKFFGRYAVLLETPFSKQTIKKELSIAGKLTGEKEIESKSALSVANGDNGYAIKSIVKSTGDGSVGVYLNGLPVNELIIHTDGSFSFYKQDRLLGQLSENGFSYVASYSQISRSGSILVTGTDIINSEDNTDDGTVNINYSGYKQGNTKYRNFNVYNGKSASVPLFQVIGKDGCIRANGILQIQSNGSGVDITNPGYLKTNSQLTNSIKWTDSASEMIAFIGFYETNNFDLSLRNIIGNIKIQPAAYVDITGELRVNGISIDSTYATKALLTAGLNKKVDAITGKQLSTEDFTTEYKSKLDSISKGIIGENGNGFISANDINEALKKNLTIEKNLSDLADKNAARINLDIYSKAESKTIFLQKANGLLELVNLTADEINGLTPEQAAELKANKQAAIRNNIDAEKKGAGDSKLAKSANLSDLPDKSRARANIGVYSVEETDAKLGGYLPVAERYTGAVFTPEHKTKLEAIKTGIFAGIDNEGKAISQAEGYVLTSGVVKELGKKANLLLDGYNDSQKKTIATNIGVYIKSESDAKYASVEELFQDFITFLVKQGKNTMEAQKILRDKLDAPGNSDVNNNYLRKDGKLSDLMLTNADAKKLACRAIGAAYAEEYETKVKDTGWLQMSNSGSGTDTRRLFVRQIGNVVCIQGVINTGKRDGGNWGGTVAIIPNTVSPPQHGVRFTACDFNDDHKYNRGCSFILNGNSRNILLYESGWNNIDTNINFTYMV
ncbi:hypothetical protein [Dysgonomonas termitidis]|uniref:DUF4347 domain-containing protein n=1 Tax=Dysgonomonas termitidis TaxID=1516126 RepID=A0ABV9KQI0_9BACT